MATEEQKKQNLVRLLRLVLFGVTSGTWDLLGDTALGLSREIGVQILPVLEKEMGLEIAGETPQAVLQEVGRLFVDEFGFAKGATIAEEGDKIVMEIQACVNRKFTDDLRAAGVGSPFVCPFMCTASAVFDRLGIKARGNIVESAGSDISTLTFELL